MQPGDSLDETGRFELAEPVTDGRSFQIVRCVDLEAGDRNVYAKAPIVDPDGGDVVERLGQWGEAIDEDAELLERGFEAFPDLVETLEVSVEGRAAPVLVYEPIPGDTLYEFVAKRPPGTIPLEMLLAVVRDVGGVVRQLHDEGLAFRDLDARHVIVSERGELRGMVGTGNVTALEERPNPVTSELSGAPYVAPEVRDERSGETLKPAADVYALAALASYAFAGQEPTTAVESPLEPEAYEALREGLADGLEELVALGLQPVAKHRATLREFLSCVSESGLAELTDPEVRSDLDIRPLPEPWSGAHPPEVNRGERSSLSPGPLISVPTDEGTGRDDQAIEGVRSAPVEEFLGEREDEERDEARTDEAGEPVREVRMVDEQLGESDRRPAPEEGAETVDWEQRAAESPLPALSDLPLKVRVAVGVGLPVLAIAIVVLLGFLGVY